MPEEICLIFHNSCDWDAPPARQRYLMAALSRYIPIIYLDGTAEQRGKVSFKNPQENVTVVKGLLSMILAMMRRKLFFLIPLYVRWKLRWVYRKYSRVLLWNMDNWTRIERWVKHDAMIFDCIDPCFSEDPKENEEFDQRETEITQLAKKTFASAETLLEKCRKVDPSAILLNNACEPGDYTDDEFASDPKPSWWPETQKPIVACLSSLDWRVDFDFLQFAAEDNPNVQFILAGNIIPDVKQRVEGLACLPNVICPGRVSVSEGRYLLSRCTVGLIPYTVSTMNDAINPVKVYLYALLGKPVVGTAIHELLIRPDIALTAGNASDFSQAIRSAMQLSASRSHQEALKEFALRNTWEQRAAQAWEEIKDL